MKTSRVMKAIAVLAMMFSVICMGRTARASYCGWKEIGDSTNWPSGGVGTWNLSLGSNYIPVAVGYNSTSTNWVWWAAGTDGLLWYLDPGGWGDNNWHSECIEPQCYTVNNLTQLLSTGQDPWASGSLSWLHPWELFSSGAYNGINEPGNNHTTGISGSGGATNFTVDASGDVFALGISGAGTCTTTGYPQGPCISFTSNSGSSWSTLIGGAEQVVSDLAHSPNLLVALGQSHHILYENINRTGGWTNVALNICGGGTLVPDQIAANDGIIWAINDNSGSAGDVYTYQIGTSSCWTYFEDGDGNHPQLLSINAANVADDHYGGVIGSDGSGNVWGYCL
jgi:hypothetical protein